jgi:three-Cys-motif partner protein
VPHKGYVWDPNGQPPAIEAHSVAKLEVLREYLLAYFQTLVVPRQDHLRLTLVDGFSGGGIYKHVDTGTEVLGSPLVMLEAAREAEALINIGRQKSFKIDARYYFIDEDKSAVDLLTHVLQQRGHSGRIGNDIKIVHSTFASAAAKLREIAKENSPTSGRAVFFLDQYGYTDVPVSEIRGIFSQLPKAEVILTFAVDALLTFVSDSPSSAKTLQAIGMPEILRGRTVEDIKNNEKDFRLYVQSQLYPDLVSACGAKFYTVFFIRTSGYGDYWLVHLSQHPRARDVMTNVHWSKNNHFVHYGEAGIDMFSALGYSPANDSAVTGQSGLFLFDNPASQRSIDALTAQLPRLIRAHPELQTFGEVYSRNCNSTPADSQKFKEAIAKLIQLGELEVTGKNGQKRRSAAAISQHDRVSLPAQGRLFVV